MLGHVGIERDLAVPFLRRLPGDDVDHAAGGSIAVACRGRPADDFDALDLFRRHPVAVTARVALPAPAVAHGRPAIDRLAVDQDQGVFRTHAAQVDLPVVAALAACRVAGEVDARHGADDLREIVGGWFPGDIFGGDDRHAGRLLERLFRRVEDDGFRECRFGFSRHGRETTVGEGKAKRDRSDAEGLQWRGHGVSRR